MPQNPDLQNYLQKLNVPDEVKADAWDAYHGAKDQGDFETRFKGLNLPDNAKADLWDMRFAKSPTGSRADVSARPSDKFLPKDMAGALGIKNPLPDMVPSPRPISVGMSQYSPVNDPTEYKPEGAELFDPTWAPMEGARQLGHAVEAVKEASERKGFADIPVGAGPGYGGMIKPVTIPGEDVLEAERKVLAPAGKAGASQLEGLMSPMSMGTMGVLGEVPVQKTWQVATHLAAGTYFGSEMATGAYEGGKQTIEDIKEGRTGDAVEHGIGAVISAGMAMDSARGIRKMTPYVKEAVASEVAKPSPETVEAHYATEATKAGLEWSDAEKAVTETPLAQEKLGEWRDVATARGGLVKVRPVLTEDGTTKAFELENGPRVPALHEKFGKIEFAYNLAAPIPPEAMAAREANVPKPAPPLEKPAASIETPAAPLEEPKAVDPIVTPEPVKAAEPTAPISPEKPVAELAGNREEFINKLSEVYQKASGLSESRAREIAMISAGIVAKRANTLGVKPLDHVNKVLADIRFGEGNYDRFTQERATTNYNQLSPEQLNSPEIKAKLGKTVVRDPVTGLPKPQFHWTKSLYRYFKGDLSEMGIHVGTAEQAAFRAGGVQGDPSKIPYGSRTLPIYVRIENPVRMIDRGSWDFDTVAERLAGIDKELESSGRAFPRDPVVLSEAEIAPIQRYRQAIDTSNSNASRLWNELHNVDYSGQTEKYAKGQKYYRVNPDTGKVENFEVFNNHFSTSGILGKEPGQGFEYAPYHLWSDIGLTPEEAQWKHERKLKLKADHDAEAARAKKLEADGIRAVQDLLRSKGYDGIVSLNRFELHTNEKVKGEQADKVFKARMNRLSDEAFKAEAGELAQDSYLIFSHDQTVNAISGLDKFERQQKYELSTQEMEELAPVLFQADANGKKILGTTSFLEDGRAIIWLHRNADASTFTHEMMHVWRRNLPVNEQEAINQAYGVQGNKWSRDDEEMFARDGEAFLTKKIKTGNERTDRLFNAFRIWMQEIYTGIKGSPLSRELSTEVTDFYTKFFGFKPSDVTGVTDTKVGAASTDSTPRNSNETVGSKMDVEPGPTRSAASVAAEYGKVKEELKRVRTRLKRADDAKRSGKKQYALDDDVYQAGKLTEQKLEDQRLDLFKEWVAQVPEEKAQRILDSIENRIRKSVGTGMQLNRLLKSAETNQLIRKALRMHGSAEGLDQDTSLQISKLIGGEEVGRFLSKGPEGQRQRLFRMLGYAERKDASGSTLMVPRILKFMPKGDLGEEMARENELARAYLKAQIADTTDPGMRKKLENLLYVDHDISNKAGEVVYQKGAERTNIILAKAQIKEQIRSASDSRYGVETAVEHPDLSISNLKQILGRELHDKMGRPSAETRKWLKELRETDPESYRVEKARLVKEFVQREMDRTRDEVRRHQKDLAAFKEARNAPKGAMAPVEEEIAAKIPQRAPDALVSAGPTLDTAALKSESTPRETLYSNLELFARKLTRGEAINPDTVTMLKLRGIIKQESKSTASYIKDVRDWMRRDQAVTKAKATVAANLQALVKSEYVYRASAKTGEVRKLKVVGPSPDGKGITIEYNGKNYDLKRTDVFLSEEAAKAKLKAPVQPEVPKSVEMSNAAKEGQPVPMDAQELMDTNKDLMPDNYTFGKSTSTEPIVINQYGAVIDGHNRLNSAARQGKEASVIIRKGPEFDVGAPVEMPTGKKGRIMENLDGKVKVRGEDGKVYQFPVEKLKLNKPQPSAPKPVEQKPVETTPSTPPEPEDGYVPSAEDIAFANENLSDNGLDSLIAKSEAEKRDAGLNWLSKKADEFRDGVITSKDKKLLLRRLNLPHDAEIGRIRQTINTLTHQTEGPQPEARKAQTGFSADEQVVWDGIIKIGKEIKTKNADFDDAFVILRGTAAKESGITDRLTQMKVLEKAMKVFYAGEVKGDPWKMKNAIDAIRSAKASADLHQLDERPQTVRSYPKKDYTPEAEKLIAREYLRTRLKEWKGYDDMEVLEHADDIQAPEVDRMVEALNDPNYTKSVARHRGRVLQGTDIAQALAYGLSYGDITKGVLREMHGNVKYDREALMHKLNEHMKEWDKRSISDTLEFVDSIEHGEYERLSPKDQVLAKLLRKQLDEHRDKIHNLGKGYLEHFYENYFPHMWKKPGKFTEFYNVFASKHPLAPKDFLKQRTLPLYADGIQAHLEPVTYNPARMAILKMYEMERFVAAHDAIETLKGYGVIKFYKYGTKTPDGLVRLKDDPLLEPKIFDKKEGALKQYGNYYAPADSARVLENLVSRGLSGKYRVYDNIRTYGNFLNQVQLSLSAFHLMFTSIDAMTSQMALGIYQASHGAKAAVRGDLGNASKEFRNAIRSLMEVPGASVSNLWRGHKFIAAYTDPAKYLEIQPLVDMIKKGGGAPFQDPIYRTYGTQMFRNAVKEFQGAEGLAKLPKTAKMAVRSLSMAAEGASWWLMEWIVPRQKMGVFMALTADYLERNQRMDISPSEPVVRADIARIWDSVDNRMGQLIYDNMFLNRTVKDLMMMSMRSPGWNIGTVRELGGGMWDLAGKPEELRDVIKSGDKAKMDRFEPISRRTAYWPAIFLTVGTIGAIYQYLRTGHGPEEPVDLFHPKTGNLGTDGYPERVNFASYMKDIYAVTEHPMQTAMHKLHPIFSMGSGIYSNKDYFGEQVYDPSDNKAVKVLKSAEYAGKQVVPFSFTNFKKLEESGAGPGEAVGAFFGITPSPKYIGKTEADNLAFEYYKSTLPSGPFTPEHMEHQRAVHKYRSGYISGKINEDQLGQAIDEGKIKPRDMDNIMDRGKTTPLEFHTKSITDPGQALRVWKLSNPEEKSRLYQTMLQKWDLVSPDDPIFQEYEKELSNFSVLK